MNSYLFVEVLSVAQKVTNHSSVQPIIVVKESRDGLGSFPNQPSLLQKRKSLLRLAVEPGRAKKRIDSSPKLSHEAR
jgi:hypothetical protein